MSTDNSGAWGEKAKELDRFLKLTKNIQEELKNTDADDDNLQMLKKIEALINERGEIIKRVSEMNPDGQHAGSVLSDDEKKQKRLCEELLKQIQSIETENKSIMDEISSGFKMRLRSNKQSRDTLGAYAMQMTGAEPSIEGNIINKLK